MALSSDNWIGIDLGTYNSSAAIRNGEKGIDIIENSDRPQAAESGERSKEFPSFISFNGDGSIDGVGIKSREKALRQPQLVVWGIKRLIGKTYTDLKENGELDRFPYRIRPDRVNGQCVVAVGERTYTPVQLCAEIFKKIKTEAERQAGVSIGSAVVSVPAYYDPLRVTPIMEAARLAGFMNVKSIPEPVAAALAYKFDITVKPIKTLVFDLGAGTLDVTTGYLYRHPEQPEECGFQVMKNTGDPKLGGIDFDDRVLSMISTRCGVGSLEKNDAAYLRGIAETAKIRLSTEAEVQQAFSLGGREYSFRMNQMDLRIALEGTGAERNLLEECRRQIMAAIDESGWTAGDVELLILIGGPTRLPCIQDVFRIIFYNRPEILRQLDEFYSGREIIDRMTAVSIGAAVSAGQSVEDKVPYGHGVEDFIFSGGERTMQPVILIPRDSPYPFRSEYHQIGWTNRLGLYELKIIQQVPKSEENGLGYEYRFMGIQKFAVKNPSFCRAAVQMGYNSNKELEVTIRNMLTDEAVTYVGINQYACIGIKYPLIVREPTYIGIEVKKQAPAAETLDRFYNWAKTASGFLRRKAESYMIPQMLVMQVLDELERMLQKDSGSMEFEIIYTRLNSLLWNANSRGLLSRDEYNDLTERLSSFESELFRVRLE